MEGECSIKVFTQYKLYHIVRDLVVGGFRTPTHSRFELTTVQNQVILFWISTWIRTLAFSIFEYLKREFIHEYTLFPLNISLCTSINSGYRQINQKNYQTSTIHS